jgi:molybdopterin-guanine dinucleotide biosynthesis protein A
MGADKAGLRAAGRSLLEWTAERLRPCCRELVVSARQPDAGKPLGVPTIFDQTARWGPIGGIVSVLRQLSEQVEPDAGLFICGCDMPFICADLVRHMAARLPGHRAVCCRGEQGIEPLHAVWSPRALPVVETLLAEGEGEGVRAVHQILASDRLDALILGPPQWRAIDPQGRSFFNVNTPEDVARLEKWLVGGGQ